MNEKYYCCLCGEDLEYEQGREVWISDFDGSYGHRYCVEKYDMQKRKNPERISKILYLIDQIWRKQSDLRFNQLIQNLQREAHNYCGLGEIKTTYSNRTDKFDNESVDYLEFTGILMDLFNVEDDKFERFLELYLEDL